MPREFTTLTLFACLLLPCAAANAAFIEFDWKSAGDNLITFDTNTGLEWLDATQSLNNSYNYINTQFGVGGDFEGFHYATTDEVTEFMRNAGWPLSLGLQFSTLAYEPLLLVQSLVGVTQDLGFMQITSGATGDPLFGARASVQIYVHPSDKTALGYLAVVDDSTAYPEIGSWLVRAHAPEPGSYALMLAGLLGWMAVRGNSRRLNVHG